MKVCSEAVPQRKMYILICGGVFTLFFFFLSLLLVGMKIPSAISYSQGVPCMQCCKL